jgi:hypothetical protein
MVRVPRLYRVSWGFESLCEYMKIVKVDMTGGGDGVYALYIDDKLVIYGDYYHNKINEYIDGFLAGLKYGKVKSTFKKIRLEDDNEWIKEVSEDGGIPPKKFEDLFKKKINQACP